MSQYRRVFFFQSVMSLKINPVLLLKFAVSSPHKNVSLISVKTVQQDKVKLSNFSSGGESILCPEQSSSWEVSRRQTCCFSGQSVLVWMLSVCFQENSTCLTLFRVLQPELWCGCPQSSGRPRSNKVGRW